MPIHNHAVGALAMGMGRSKGATCQDRVRYALFGKAATPVASECPPGRLRQHPYSLTTAQ